MLSTLNVGKRKHCSESISVTNLLKDRYKLPNVSKIIVGTNALGFEHKKASWLPHRVDHLWYHWSSLNWIEIAHSQ